MDKISAREVVCLPGPVNMQQIEVLEQIPKGVTARLLGNWQGYINIT